MTKSTAYWRHGCKGGRDVSDFLDRIGVWNNPPGWAQFMIAFIALGGAFVLATFPARSATRLLLSLEGMDTEIASKIAANGIVTRDALADLAGDELVELTGMDPTKAQDLIMKARAHWFEPAVEAPQTSATA